MALLKQKLKTKLKGSTLIESLVALILVMLAMGIAATVFTNVMSFSNYNAQSRAVILLNRISMETKKDKMYLDGTLTDKEFVIEKRVSPYNNSRDLSVLWLKAYDKKEKLIAERKELFSTE